MLLLFGLILLHGRTEVDSAVCEPIKIDMCRGLGYNVTTMPNFVGHEIQKDAEFTLQTFSPLIQYGCSAQLHLFLCSVYAPMCTEKVPAPIGPCRGLCEQVRARCSPILQGFGFPWPTALNCSKFPPKNNHHHMCMEGPGEPGPINSIQTITAGNGAWSCSAYANAGKYVFLNRSGRCAAICDADILWSHREKRLVDAWMAAFVTICLVSIAAGIITLLKPKKHRGGISLGESAITYLVMCHAAVGIGYVIRLAAGRLAVACAPVVSLYPQDQVVIVQQHESHQPQAPGQLELHDDYIHPEPHTLPITSQHQEHHLTQDGLTNPYCTVVFLLLYYFGSAATVWWVVLSAWWCVVTRKWNCSSSPARNANKDDDGFHTKQNFTTLAAVAAWGFPAAHTITVLITRDVDADELMGNCFVGQQNTRSLLLLVLLPQLIYLAVGSTFLLLGISSSLTTHHLSSVTPTLSTLYAVNPLIGNQREAKSLAKIYRKKKSLLTRSGIFACFYAIVMIFVTSITFYEWWGRDIWLKAREPSNTPRLSSRPHFYLFILKVVVFLSAGAAAAGWIWWPSLMRLWRKMPPPQCSTQTSVHKCHSHNILPVVQCYTTDTSVRSMTIRQIDHLSLDLSRTTSLVQQPQHYRNYKNHRKHNRIHRSDNETEV